MYTSLGSQLEKLTLFKPVVEKVQVIKPERPVTPIYDEVSEPAVTLDELHKLLKRRLLVTRTWALSFLSANEQEELASILFSEVTKIWPDLQSCGHMALLNETQNKSMLRRMTIYVVTTCEILFDRHIEIFQNMLKTGVFEKFSNFVRIKQLLAEEAVRLLDVLTIRRYIGDDIRAMDNGQIEATTEDVTVDQVSFAHLVTLSRPPLEAKYKWTLESDIRVLKSKLPNLDLSVLRSVLSTLPPLPPITLSETTTNKSSKDSSDKGKQLQRISTEELLMASTQVFGDRVITKSAAKRTVSATDPLKYYEPEFSLNQSAETFITQPVELSSEAKKAIIKSTTKVQVADDSEVTIQPLLKASLYLEGPSRRLAEKEVRIAELQKIIAELEKKRQVEVRRSVHLQPDYFEVPISKDLVMRASGPRVTERQLEAAMSLQSLTPYFDELNFDITEEDIAEMDESLFVQRELADVYKEIVAVIPKDYLEVSSDKTVQPTASGPFDLVRCIASARLQRSTGGGSATISKLPASGFLPLAINEAPWHKEGFKTWVKNGPSKILNTTSRNRISVPLPPGSAGVGRHLSQSLPDYMDPKMFMQWHSWWRQIFTSDDYYKYINRQDTDFLAYVFHLWGDEGGRMDSAIGLSSGPGTPISSASPVRGKKEASTLSNSALGSLGPTPAPGSGPGMWVQDTTIREPLETEAAINDRSAKMIQIAKEGARIYSVTGITQSMSLADMATQRIEDRRKEELAKRKLSPDEVLEKELAAMTIQQRFDRVWNLLRLDEEVRARMTFKYSGSDTARLLHLVKLWESAAHAILRREYTLGQFEQFERIASDPNRFFEKGYLGSTQARLDEEVVRASLSRQLDEHEVKVKTEITRVANGTGGDVVMFRNQTYVDKMRGDRVQVLFWLSEERKAEAIRRHLADKKLNEALFNSPLIGAAVGASGPLALEPQEQPVRDMSSPLPLTLDELLASL